MWEFFEAMIMEKDDPSIPDIYAQACVKAETQLKARLPRLSE